MGQKLIQARGDRRKRGKGHTCKISLTRACAHTHTQTHGGARLPPFSHKHTTLDLLPFILAGAFRGNSGRNPFSTGAGAAVPIPN